jgi:hypothetical protein
MTETDMRRGINDTRPEKPHRVFHTSKLSLNAHADIVEKEFPKEELARIGERNMVAKESPILDENVRTSERLVDATSRHYLVIPRYVWDKLRPPVEAQNPRRNVQGAYLQVERLLHVEYCNCDGRDGEGHHDSYEQQRFRLYVYPRSIFRPFVTGACWKDIV